MLALTECRSGVRGRVGAAAAGNTVADWTSLLSLDNSAVAAPEWTPESFDRDDVGDEAEVFSGIAKKGRKKKKQQESWTNFGAEEAGRELTATEILKARSSTFWNSEAWFDAFASPVAFFRSPGIDIPDSSSKRSPLPSPRPDIFIPDSDVPPEWQTNSSQPPTRRDVLLDANGGMKDVAIKRRKVHRRYPPVGSGLKLPFMRISAGEQSPLLDQSIELVGLMRRSVIMHEQRMQSMMAEEEMERSAWNEEVRDRSADAVREAQRRVELVSGEGQGLWCARDRSGLEEVARVGSWFSETLG